MGNRPFSRKNCNFFCKLTAFYPLRHGFAVPAPPRGRLCAMPGSLPSPLKPSPWGRWLRPAGADGRGAPSRQRPRPLRRSRASSPKGRALGMAEKLPVELQLSFAFTTPPVKMRLERSAELVGAKPLHLLTQTALPLKSPTGAFIAAQTRSLQTRNIK